VRACKRVSGVVVLFCDQRRVKKLEIQILVGWGGSAGNSRALVAVAASAKRSLRVVVAWPGFHSS
jgi:hypothetical protein